MSQAPESFEERRSVSRKTPNDGKLEISPDAARRLPPSGEFPLTLDGTAGEAGLVSFPCTCRGPEAHVHYFLRSALLRALTPEREVLIRIAPDGTSASVERIAAPR